MDKLRELLLKSISSDNAISSLRVISYLLVIAGIGIAYLGLFMNKNLESVSILSGTLIGFGVGGKVAQKVTENKE